MYIVKNVLSKNYSFDRSWNNLNKLYYYYTYAYTYKVSLQISYTGLPHTKEKKTSITIK